MSGLDPFQVLAIPAMRTKWIKLGTAIAGITCVDENGDRARDKARGQLSNRAHQNFRFTLETVPPDQRSDVEKFMKHFDVTKKIDQRFDPRLVTNPTICHRRHSGRVRRAGQRARARRDW